MQQDSAAPDHRARGAGPGQAALPWQVADVGPLHPAVAAPLAGVATSRPSIGRLRADDLDPLAAILADPEVWGFEYGRGMTRLETEAFLSRQLDLWAQYGFGGCGVREVGRSEVIGVVGLSVPVVQHELVPDVTVGWRFSPTIWGKGYATEAATAVLDQAFTKMALDRVGCITNAENLRSVRVAERLGMTFMAEASVPSDDGTRMVTGKLFQIARDDWLTARKDRSPRT
jgi:RimJ/RimL family protein N-acetyltransferase